MKNSLALALCFSLALGFSACGGDDDDDIPEVTDAGQTDAGTSESDGGTSGTDAGTSETGASTMVISQIYIGGTGGNDAIPSAYDKVYVELFNGSAAPVDMKDYALVYGGKTGTASMVAELADDCYMDNCIVPPGGYFLIAISVAHNASGASKVSMDVDLELQNTSVGEKGLYAIVRDNTLVAGVSKCADILAAATDSVAGSGNECVQSRAPALDRNRGSSAITRRGGGCMDTDDSYADFEIQAARPRNMRSPVKVCQ